MIIYLSKYIAENIIESIKYKYLLTITYVIEINKELYEIKKLKKLKRFTVKINEKQSKVEINHKVKIKKIIKIEIKDSVKIIENRNKIYYFLSDIEIFNFYFNFIEFFLSLYPLLVIHY